MSAKSDEEPSGLALCCSEADACFCGLVPIRFGATVVSAFGLALLLILLAFNLVVFIVIERIDSPLSWHPHIALLLTLIFIAVVVYVLSLAGSLRAFRFYTDVFYLIFMIVNIIVLLFHLFSAIIALALALSLIALLGDNPNAMSSIMRTTTISPNSVDRHWKVVYLQFGRFVLYLIISVCQIYAEFVIGRARKYWIRHEKDQVLFDELARQKYNESKKKKKSNKVSSVKFDTPDSKY